jgi:hypothetical protein
MSEKLHARASQLLAKSYVEGLAPDEQSWLTTHLASCLECARESAVTSDVLRALRSVPISAPRELAARTQLRVRMRVEQSHHLSSRSILLWLITGMSWLLGVFSAPLVWRAFTSVGDEFGLPKLVLQMGFFLWWALPALFAVAVVLHQKSLTAYISGRSSRG